LLQSLSTAFVRDLVRSISYLHKIAFFLYVVYAILRVSCSHLITMNRTIATIFYYSFWQSKKSSTISYLFVTLPIEKSMQMYSSNIPMILLTHYHILAEAIRSINLILALEIALFLQKFEYSFQVAFFSFQVTPSYKHKPRTKSELFYIISYILSIILNIISIQNLIFVLILNNKIIQATADALTFIIQTPTFLFFILYFYLFFIQFLKCKFYIA